MSSNAFSKFAYLKALHRRSFPRGDGAYRVLVTVLDYANEDGRNAHPGITRLADDCLMGESTVRRHLKWLKDNGYVIQETRGHNVGDANLASVYTLSMPDLPPVNEHKAGAPTAQLEPPTAQLEQTYRSVGADLPLTGERLSDPLSDPLPDPSTSDPGANDPRCQECEDAEVNVCMRHYHERHHRYREPAEGTSSATDAAACLPPSRPHIIENNETRCTVLQCTTPIAPLSNYFCAEHLGAYTSGMKGYANEPVRTG